MPAPQKRLFEPLEKRFEEISNAEAFNTMQYIGFLDSSVRKNYLLLVINILRMLNEIHFVYFQDNEIERLKNEIEKTFSEKNRIDEQVEAMKKRTSEFHEYLLRFTDEATLENILATDNVDNSSDQAQSIIKCNIGRYGSYYRLMAPLIRRRKSSVVKSQSRDGQSPSPSSIIEQV